MTLAYLLNADAKLLANGHRSLLRPMLVTNPLRLIRRDATPQTINETLQRIIK